MKPLYRQGIPSLDLWIERGTDRAPDRCHFFVFSRGRVVGRHKRLAAAVAQYSALKAEMGYTPPPPAPLSEEEERILWLRGRADYDRLKHEINSAIGMAWAANNKDWKR